MSTSADEPLDASIPGISIILSDAVAMPIAAEMGEQPALAAIASLSADLKAALGRMVGTVENRIANSSVCVDEIERACAQFAEVRLFGLDSDGVRAVNEDTAKSRASRRLAELILPYVSNGVVYKSLSDFVGQLTPKLSPLLQTLAKSGDADTFSRLSDALLTTFIMSKAQIAQLERRAAKAEARAPVIKLALQPAPTPVVQTEPAEVLATPAPVGVAVSVKGPSSRDLHSQGKAAHIAAMKPRAAWSTTKKIENATAAQRRLTSLLSESALTAAHRRDLEGFLEAVNGKLSTLESQALLEEVQYLRDKFCGKPGTEGLTTLTVTSSAEYAAMVRLAELLEHFKSVDAAATLSPALQEQALTAALATLNALAATMQNNGLVDFCERLDDFVQQCTAARAALQAEDAVTVDEGVVVEPIAAGGAGAPEADVSTQRAQSLESTRTIGVLPVNFDALTEDALTMFSTLDPSLQEIERLDAARLAICDHLRRPDIRMFGSAYSLFAIRGTADIDLCCVDTRADTDKKERQLIQRLAADLKRHARLFENVIALSHQRIRIPIVTGKVLLTDTSASGQLLHRVEFDLSVNNSLALHNTTMLRTYGQLDPRVRQLGLLVKHWAKVRKINTTRDGTLSSYAYVVVVLFFLQNRPSPVIPNLQDIGRLREMCPSISTVTTVVDGYSVEFCDDLPNLRDAIMPHYACGDSLGQLLAEFFHFFGRVYVHGEDCVSLRLGKIVDRETLYPKGKEDRISIEDPFELTHDLGQVVSPMGQEAIAREFTRASELFQSFAEGDIDTPSEVVSMLYDPTAKALPPRGRGRRGPPPTVTVTDRKCFNCGGTGHIKADCHSKSTGRPRPFTTRPPRTKGPVVQLRPGVSLASTSEQ